MSTSTNPRLNWRLITKVLRYIKRHPDRYDQNTWLDYEGKTKYSDKYEAYVPDGQPSLCNTQGCFAGWCVMLSSSTKEWRKLLHDTTREECYIDWQHETAKRCGFTEDEADYLTDGASGDAEEQYETIRNRICAIVRARKTGESFGEAEQHIELYGQGATNRGKQKSEAA